MKIGIFGGTFNPIHYGHLRAAEEAREKVDLDRIIFMPAGNPPLKTEDIADAVHRYEMVKLALAGNESFEISDIEYKSKEKSYTVNTLQELKKAHPKAEFFFILGIDAFLDLPNWRQPEILIALVNFIIISRPNFKFMDMKRSPYLRVKKTALKDLDNAVIETYVSNLRDGRDAVLLKLTDIGISSSEIRRLIRLERSIKYLLPPEVQSYIITNEFYKS